MSISNDGTKSFRRGQQISEQIKWFWSYLHHGFEIMSSDTVGRINNNLKIQFCRFSTFCENNISHTISFYPYSKLSNIYKMLFELHERRLVEAENSYFRSCIGLCGCMPYIIITVHNSVSKNTNQNIWPKTTYSLLQLCRLVSAEQMHGCGCLQSSPL